jgi:hypothetical protein
MAVDLFKDELMDAMTDKTRISPYSQSAEFQTWFTDQPEDAGKIHALERKFAHVLLADNVTSQSVKKAPNKFNEQAAHSPLPNQPAIMSKTYSQSVSAKQPQAPPPRIGYVRAERVSTVRFEGPPPLKRVRGYLAPLPFALYKPQAHNPKKWNYGTNKTNGEPNWGNLRPSQFGCEEWWDPGFCFVQLWTRSSCKYNVNCRWNHERPSKYWCEQMVETGRCGQETIDYMLQCWDSSPCNEPPTVRYTIPQYRADGTVMADPAPGINETFTKSWYPIPRRTN